MEVTLNVGTVRAGSVTLGMNGRGTHDDHIVSSSTGPVVSFPEAERRTLPYWGLVESRTRYIRAATSTSWSRTRKHAVRVIEGQSSTSDRRNMPRYPSSTIIQQQTRHEGRTLHHNVSNPSSLVVSDQSSSSGAGSPVSRARRITETSFRTFLPPNAGLSQPHQLHPPRAAYVSTHLATLRTTSFPLYRPPSCFSSSETK